MQNAVGLLLACLGMFAAVGGAFGVRPAFVVAGLLLLVGSLALLIDVDRG